MTPWEFHPDLLPERLIELGHIIRQARDQAVELHDESLGDDAWSLGCRAYSWCRNRIIDAADEGIFDWLSIDDRGMHFVFRIGGIPVRFFRGDADDPNDRTLRVAADEARQLELVFPNENPTYRLIWRFAVETDIDAAVHRIVFLGMTRSAEVKCFWEVPPKAASPDGGISVPASADVVELPPPAVRLAQRTRRRAGGG